MHLITSDSLNQNSYLNMESLLLAKMLQMQERIFNFKCFVNIFPKAVITISFVMSNQQLSPKKHTYVPRTKRLIIIVISDIRLVYVA